MRQRRGEVVLFGGGHLTANSGTLLGDTWSCRTTLAQGSDCSLDTDCLAGHCVNGGSIAPRVIFSSTVRLPDLPCAPSLAMWRLTMTRARMSAAFLPLLALGASGLASCVLPPGEGSKVATAG